MKKYILLVSGLLLGLLLWQCQRDINGLPDNNKPVLKNLNLTADEHNLAGSTQQFGFGLFHEVNAQKGDTNIILSPLSVSMALGMTLNGSANTTYDSMAQTLGFAGMSNQAVNEAYLGLISKLISADDKVLFELANSIWYRNTFDVLQEFIDVNTTYFNAQIFPADFNDPATVDLINNWVNEKTHGKITQILDQIDPLAVMFLMNAIYLKAVWTYQFDKDNTLDGYFFSENGGASLPCKMMNIRGFWDYYEDEQLQAVDMPYGGGNFSMTVLLPKADIASVNDVISDLNEQRWQEIISHFTADSGNIALPKFKLHFDVTLNDALKQMGMGVAFNPTQADFTRINPQADLYISFVKHKTFIQVDEEGTEAAAVTIVGVYVTGTHEPPPGFTMCMDHPFVFVIREKTSGAVIFMGKIVAPKWEE